jgi:peptide/nickel transport system permease protein
MYAYKMREIVRGSLGAASGFGVFMLRAVAVILIIATCNFILIKAAPGDPALVLAGESGATDARFIETVRVAYGLDQPVLAQYWRYISSIMLFDLGMSHRHNLPVAEVIASRAMPTLILTSVAFLISILTGCVLGLIASLRQGGLTDRFIVISAIVFYSVPPFWLGLTLIYIFSVKLGWFPPFGMMTVTSVSPMNFVEVAVDLARHLVLPVASLAIIYTAIYARLTRQAAIEAGSSAYTRTARAKGLGERAILLKDVLPNALIPVVTFGGMHVATLLGGSIVVETVFAWPGLGRLAFEAVMQRNYPLLLGILVVLSVFVIVLNALTDLVIRMVDPRIGAQL